MTHSGRPYGVTGRPRRPTGVRAGLPWLLAAATVATQIAYPLVDEPWLRRVTIASVALFFLTCLAHAAVHRGGRWVVVLLLVTAGGGLAVEALGVRTGWPFGDYTYTDTLGPEIAGVPAVVPLAWTMIAYPVFLAARRVTRRWVPLLGGIGMAGWDVFLDPQMVSDGRWRWADPSPSLPGVDSVPLSNVAGWLVVGVVMMAVLHVLLPRDRASEAVPATLFFWTYLGSVAGNVFWFGSTGVARAGAVAMGLLALPYAWSLWQSRP